MFAQLADTRAKLAGTMPGQGLQASRMRGADESRPAPDVS